MIARSWRATATRDGARRYEEHFRDAVLPDLRTVPGFRTAYLMRRDAEADDATADDATADDATADDGAAADADGTVQLHVLTFWDSMASVTGFAGETPGAAVVHPDARAVLLTFDRTVDHYEAQQHQG